MRKTPLSPPRGLALGQVSHPGTMYNLTRCTAAKGVCVSETIACQHCARATTLASEIVPLGSESGHRIYLLVLRAAYVEGLGAGLPATTAAATAERIGCQRTASSFR